MASPGKAMITSGNATALNASITITIGGHLEAIEAFNRVTFRPREGFASPEALIELAAVRTALAIHCPRALQDGRAAIAVLGSPSLLREVGVIAETAINGKLQQAMIERIH